MGTCAHGRWWVLVSNCSASPSHALQFTLFFCPQSGSCVCIIVSASSAASPLSNHACCTVLPVTGAEPDCSFCLRAPCEVGKAPTCFLEKVMREFLEKMPGDSLVGFFSKHVLMTREIFTRFWVPTSSCFLYYVDINQINQTKCQRYLIFSSCCNICFRFPKLFLTRNRKHQFPLDVF